jgi:hypothetical protein
LLKKSFYVDGDFKSFNISQTLDELNKLGYSVIEDFATNITIEEITKEFELLFISIKQGYTRSVSNGNYGFFPSEWVKKNKDIFKKIYKFLNNENLIKIGKDFLKIKNNNHTINRHFEFEINKLKGASTASLPHFDRQPALKMFLYLTDVTKTSGATFYYPQTYREIRHHIFSILSNCSDIHQLKNFISELNISSKKVDIECRKGTLMICDTAGLHGGGNILENNITRKVIRGVTFYLPESYTYLNKDAVGISEKNFKDFFNRKTLRFSKKNFMSYDQIKSC